MNATPPARTAVPPRRWSLAQRVEHAPRRQRDFADLDAQRIGHGGGDGGRRGDDGRLGDAAGADVVGGGIGPTDERRIDGRDVGDGRTL